eukprot:Hpha_TRINITY_DN13563_c0_g2::TRINITY_DN13563_c0_g2_i1::g.111558::m.111558
MQEDMMQRLAESLQCCVCMDADKDTVLMPCRHLCVCESCSRDVMTCPLCRKDVTERVRVWTGMERAQISPRKTAEYPDHPPVAGPQPPAEVYECPLHGPMCAAGPFTDRGVLDYHVNTFLDSGRSPTPPPPPAQPAAAPGGQQLVCLPPPPIVVEPKDSVAQTGAWGLSHQVYYFNLVACGESFYFGARYSALKKLAASLGPLHPHMPFPASQWWAWFSGKSTDDRTTKRHQELAEWLQDLFAPRAVWLRHSSAMDAGAVCHSSVIPEALGLPPAAAQVLRHVGELRRGWFTNAVNIIASFGVSPGTPLRASVPPSMVPAP